MAALRTLHVELRSSRRTPRGPHLAVRLGAALIVACAASACGKKGPPRPPLNLVPDAPQAVSGRRIGNTEFLQLTVPTKNANGPGAVDLARLDVYGVTVAADVPLPPNKDLLKPAYVIGHIDVRPPVDPDAPPEDSSHTDTRPRPGDVVTFVETLTRAQETPEIVATPLDNKKRGNAAKKKTPGASTAAQGGPGQEAQEAPAGAPVPLRVYMIRGVSTKGRQGAPSARIAAPLVTPPPAISAAPQVAAGKTSVTLSWTPPPSNTDEALDVTYNVYAAPADQASVPTATSMPVPLNPAPLATLTFEHDGAEPGKEQCFVIRTVATVAGVPIESAPSPRGCVTPRDVFPPAAPKNLAVVPGTNGRMNLIWDANTEPDLAGYLVLRGEAPGDTLQPLTPTPIKETRYTDETAKPGVTYVYAVRAVDTATPPNRSALSNRVTETAR